MAKPKVSAAAYIWAAALLILLPLKWLVSAVIAASIHELSHLLALRLRKCRVRQIRIGIFCAEIETGPVSDLEEMLCALAGPAGSLLLTVFYRLSPEIALCALVQGLFNLLPVYPLDGGRVLRSLVRMVSNKPDRVIKWMEIGILCALMVLSVLCVFVFHIAFPLPAAVLIMTGNALLRKIPCKPGQQALQWTYHFIMR